MEGFYLFEDSIKYTKIKGNKWFLTANVRILDKYMDLVATGKSKEKAMLQLVMMIGCHVSVAQREQTKNVEEVA